MNLSLCMIVRDEEEDLHRCLESVRGVVDEMIVVDTGSADRTVEIARAHDAKVFSHPWTGDFSEARNRGLDLATGDWILVLDADEELPEETRGTLRKVVQSTTAQGLQVRIRNLAPPGELLAYQDKSITRIFRSAPAHRYETPIHEQITPSILRAGGRIDGTDLLVLHSGYARSTVQGGVDRARRNLSALEQSVELRPDDAYIWYQLGCTYKAVGRDADAVEAFQRSYALDPHGDILEPEARATLFTKLAQIALGRRQDLIAAEMAEASLATRPGNALALQILGLARIELKDLHGAFLSFSDLLECENLTPEVRRDIGKIREALKPHGRSDGR
jgi:glycosyltransferase involved in cell wall biosynthesis